MRKVEYKSLPFEVKEVDLQKGHFTGYAAVFNNLDAWRDIILPGAFAKTLKEHAQRVKVLWQHNTHAPIGKPISMEEDAKGLLVTAKISETTQGKDVLTLLRDGVINELSIGFSAIKETFDKEQDIRFLNEVKLWEFSPVTWAANEQALITGAKSISLKDLSDEEIEIFHKRFQALREKQEPPLSRPDPADVQSVLATLKEIRNQLK